MGYDSRNIKDVRFGSIQAKALYLGNVLIWPLGPAPIPTTYTRLEYIKTDDTAYLDVGEPLYKEGMTDPHEFFTFGYDIELAPECPAVISGSGADMNLGINGYGYACGEPMGINRLDTPGQEVWMCPYPDNETRAYLGRRTTIGYDRIYVGDTANDIHSNVRAYIDGESFDSVVTFSAREGGDEPIDPTDPQYESADGQPFRWTLSTQDPAHDPNENVPGKYYEFRIYDIDASGNRVLVATSYPVRKTDGTVNAYGLYTVYADGSEGQFVPFGGSSAGVQLGPDYSPNVHTVYIPTVAYAQRDCHLFDDGTNKFAYSNRDLTTYYPAGSYSTADGDRIVVNADGTWDYAAPPEYVELEWISSGTNNDYLAIDTGVVACNQYRMVADVQWNAHNSQVQRFGSQWCTGPGTSGDYYTFAFGTTESGWSMNTGFGGGKWEISSGRDTDRHVFDAMFYSPYTGKFDSTSHTFPNTGTSMPPSNVNTLMLFGRHRWTGSGVEVDNYCSCKLYSCQIYDQSGNLVRDFVPAKFADGSVGMYDRVEGVQYLSWNTSSFEPGPEKSATPVTFNYVNGTASSTTLYLYNSKLYADATMSTPASAGTYVNASYRYVVVSGGSFTYETYSTVTTTTPAATLYLTASKAYSNPGMTTYPAAGEYANNDWKYVVASDGSYTKEPVTPTGDYIELQYVTVPTGSQGDFLYQYNGNNAGTYKIEFGYSPDSTAVEGYSAGFYLGSVDSPQGPGTNGANYCIWGPGWSSAASSVPAVAGTKHNFSFSFDRSTGASLSIDGTTNTWGAGNFTFGNFGSFHIDGGSPSGSAAGDCALSGKWYAVKEYFNGILTHDYIPAKSPDGTKVGFYDTLTDQWVLCSAGAAWSAGPEA